MPSVNDVITGVEFEVGLRSRGDSQLSSSGQVVDAFPDFFTSRGFSGGLGKGDLAGWQLIRESPMGCEFILTQPVPYGQWLDRMGQLMGFFEHVKSNGWSVRLCDYSCSMHVHVNRKVGKPRVPVEKYLDAYFDNDEAIRSEWWNLIDRKYERGPRTGWCRKFPSKPVALFESKGRELVSNSVGSVENRVWDATTKWDLIERRYALLGELIERALKG